MLRLKGGPVEDSNVPAGIDTAEVRVRGLEKTQGFILSFCVLPV